MSSSLTGSAITPTNIHSLMAGDSETEHRSSEREVGSPNQARHSSRTVMRIRFTRRGTSNLAGIQRVFRRGALRCILLAAYGIKNGNSVHPKSFLGITKGGP